jgi:DNA-binding CsgD family transcriptional regulator
VIEDGLQRLIILQNLHRKPAIWDEELIGDLFSYVYTRVLTKTERIIVDNKIAGLVDGEIAVLLQSQVSTIKTHIYNIKRKYRNQTNKRVDHYQVFRRRKQQHEGSKRNS